MSIDAQSPTNVIEYHKKENGEIELGPNYSVRLPDSFPLANGGMRQAAPRRAELARCSEKFSRVACAYEVSVAHLHVAVEYLNRAKVDLAHAEATKLEIGNQIIRVLSEYEQRKREEMKTDMDFENEVAWEHLMMGISESLSLAKGILTASQPVDAESRG